MRERARIADLHCHDLRLELGSRLRETPGMPDYELRDWLRHANIATTIRYLSTMRVGVPGVLGDLKKHEIFARPSYQPVRDQHSELRRS